MPRRSRLVFIVVLIIFALALSIVLPIDEGILGKRGIRLGLDLQGGIHMVYKADLSSVESGGEASAIEG
ncbi:protein translocase subunit SecD, partial [Chloroflexota bacterium]